MLRFAQRPDPIFLAILHAALEDLQETLADLEAEDWPAQYSTAARCFSRELARTTLAQLLPASRAKQLYQLTDYHWLLLHDCLRVYCAIHKRRRPRGPDPDPARRHLPDWPDRLRPPGGRVHLGH